MATAAQEITPQQTLVPFCSKPSENKKISKEQTLESDRGRSRSGSWPLWGSFWFPSSSGSSSSSPNFARETTHLLPFFPSSNGPLALRETRRLVRHYDAALSSNLKAHEQFKFTKWGENVFCDVDVDTTALDLSFVDSLLPLTDTLAQCVRSYSKFLSTQLFRRRRQVNLCNNTTQPLMALPSTEQTNEVKTEVLPSSSTTVFSTQQNGGVPSVALVPVSSDKLVSEDQTWLGELAIPRAVQEVLDFAVAVSLRAGQAIEAILPPSCPKRSHSVFSGEKPRLLPNRKNPCPRRLRKNAVAADGEANEPSQLTTANQTSGYVSCPRRAVRSTRCSRRSHRKHKEGC